MFGDCACCFILITGFMVANLSTLWLLVCCLVGLTCVFVGYFVATCGWCGCAYLRCCVALRCLVDLVWCLCGCFSSGLVYCLRGCIRFWWFGLWGFGYLILVVGVLDCWLLLFTCVLFVLGVCCFGGSW